MATKATHRHHKTFARAEKPRCFCLLLLSVVIFGVSKGSAVPRLAMHKPYSLIDVSARRRMLSETEEFPLAKQTLSFNPLGGGRRWLQSLYRHRDLSSHDESSSATFKRQRVARKQILGPVVRDKHRATNLHRVPLSEEETEREEGHADENSHEEGVSADSAEEEDGYEEGEDDDDDDEDEEEESEEEPSDDDDEKHIDLKGKSSSRNAKVSSRVNEEAQEEKLTTQSVEKISQTIRTAADEGSVSEAEGYVDTAEKQGSHDEGSAEQTSDSGKESESEKGGSGSYRGQFRGVPGGSIDGTNVTHISYMLYKIVKKYDIKTIVDIPCRNNLQWFPELLNQIEFEVIGFKYICVDEGANRDSNLRNRFSNGGSTKFLSVPPTESDRLPKSDLVFSYDGPQKWGVRKTWTFFTGLRKVRPKYIIVTNNPGQKNNDEEETLNLRKQPFHFTQAMRVISNVDTRRKAKQLVFYETENIREGF